MLDWIGSLPPAVYLQRSPNLYVLVNAAHIAALGVLIGAIVALDCRVLGAARTLPFAVMGPYLSRIARDGLLVAVATGAWLFSVRPHEYVENAAFLVKVGLVTLGVLNAVWLHRRADWSHAVGQGKMSTAMRLHASASLMLWFGAVLAGRWIGFL
ncbi:DUF6644 family protein [Schauerella aestuarii]|uniref:DUF6644 family protein n=1 Tax=Schauerella aestuarii TaxID=2511204 RepID=UPI0013701580|nr:DUF6644 family protein [Achromobacter aestuarii]MYZ44709.1 DUF2214 domain-containing protein [Achromobacter aestuarii]